MTTITGTSGNDNKTGTASADTFNMSQGGSDTVNGEGGNDIFNFGAKLDVNDKINGGSGDDTLKLDGGYNLTFGSATLTSVETINLAAGHNYVLRTNNANVASGATLTVYGGNLGSANHLDFDGSAETNGKFVIHGGAGSDEIEGGQGGDVIYDRVGGTDQLSGDDGADTFNLGAFLTGADQISGGVGNDKLNITGDYTGSHALVLKTANIDGIQTLHLGAGFKYTITTADEGFASGDTNSFHMTVDGSSLASGNTMTINAQHMRNTALTIKGGAASDTFNFGGRFDVLDTDKIDGGAGTDTLNLNGDYNFLNFGASGILSVEKIVLAAGHDYNIITADGSVASGKTLTLDATALGSGNSLTFDGSAETNGKFVLHGGAGNDDLTGGSGADTFYDRSGGNDKVDAGGGGDTINMGAKLTGADTISGYTGNDKVSITGDYTASHALTMTASTLTSVESLILGAGHDYTIKTAGDGSTSHQILTIDGSALAAANTLNVTVGTMVDSGVSILGGAGADTFSFGAHYGGQKIDGGAGTDTLNLNGDYSGPVDIESGHLLSVENIVLAAGHTYNIDFEGGNLTSSQTLTVDGSALGASDRLFFADINSATGHFVETGGAGDDQLTGGTESDTLSGGGGGDVFYAGGGGDTINGGGGNDFALYATGQMFTTSDHFNGGSGVDELVLTGDYSAGFTLSSAIISSVEAIFVDGGNDYSLTIADSAVAAGATLDIGSDGDQGLGASNTLHVDGSAETDGNLGLYGGAGADTLIGGSGDDTIGGGLGADSLVGHGGADTFYYAPVSDSTGPSFDIITGFDATEDKFDTLMDVAGVDATVTGGELSVATFNADLRAAIKAGDLAANDAVLFKPDSGDYAGDTFLIVDANGQAGYQNNADLVIELNGGHLTGLSAANFI
ncbi:MAG TPA: calcium-binding protein [Rhizomicrobium sp.]|jgi:Ca2+-binding RTX toxin-like protein|nr:calcium-binding protein [Rhizomicrobium sp.]